MVAASILFAQGVEVGEIGASYIVDKTAGAVNISNGAPGGNTGATTWTFQLLDSPYGSAIAPAVLASGGTNNYSFTWDVPGTYRIMMTVTGSGSATDTRDIIVLTTRRGWYRPGYLTIGPEYNSPVPDLGVLRTPEGGHQRKT